jgi:hypothetical protein
MAPSRVGRVQPSRFQGRPFPAGVHGTPAARATDTQRANSVDGSLLLPQDGSVGERTESDRRTLWLHLALGAAVGLGLGIVVSVLTDVPFAPEIGLVVGLAAAWGLRLLTNS